MGNIYEDLRSRLDDLATGFPTTESEIEIRLLERLKWLTVFRRLT